MTYLNSAMATSAEYLVAKHILDHKGRKNPISIAALCRLTNHTEREIKGIVEQLVVTHKMQIGSSRVQPYGYFLIVDAEDAAVACSSYRRQVLAMWRRLRVLDSPHALRELHGQLTLEGSVTA